MSNKQEPLHLTKLLIDNFMRVQALRVDADGKHVILRGENASGKSSVLLGLWTTLSGYSTKAIPEPIRHGADEASVTIELGEYIIERRWDKKGTRLIVTAADGSRVRAAQDLLNGLLGSYSLDPVAFLSLRPQDQCDHLLLAAGVKPPVKEVRHITGENHDPLPGESAASYLERLSADISGTYFVRRREKHRELDQKRAALEEQRQQLANIGGVLRPEEREFSASDLVQQIEDLQKDADMRRRAESDAADAAREHQKAVDLLEQIGSEMELKRAKVTALDQQIAELQRERARTQEEADRLGERIERGKEVIVELTIEKNAAADAVDGFPDPGPRMLDLRRQLGHVKQSNAALVKRRLAQEQMERLAHEADICQTDHKAMDGVLESLRRLRANLLNGVDLGVSGLEVGLGELRLNGVPFRQASMAEQIRTACAVAFKQNPRLRLLRVDNCEHLDSKSRQLLLELADANGWQVVMATVADGEALRVEIVEVS